MNCSINFHWNDKISIVFRLLRQQRKVSIKTCLSCNWRWIWKLWFCKAAHVPSLRVIHAQHKVTRLLNMHDLSWQVAHPKYLLKCWCGVLNVAPDWLNHELMQAEPEAARWTFSILHMDLRTSLKHPSVLNDFNMSGLLLFFFCLFSLLLGSLKYLISI